RGDDGAVGDAAAVPRPGRVGLADVRHGREGHRLLHDEAELGPAEANPAAVPQPRQPRDLGRPARSLPRREGRGGRRLHPAGDRGSHTMRWPLRFGAKYREFGGSFIYPMGEDRISMGLVVGLDYRDATFSVHDALQEFKTHPKIRELLEGGKRVAWGAKTIPSGGYWAMPKQLWARGVVLAGDGAGMGNIPKLKGMHLAMRAGMYAAEEIPA